MNWWRLGWLLLLLTMAVYEGITIRRKAPGDTLSEQFRHWFHTDSHRKRPLAIAIWAFLWVTFAVWFLVHIAT